MGGLTLCNHGKVGVFASNFLCIPQSGCGRDQQSSALPNLLPKARSMLQNLFAAVCKFQDNIFANKRANNVFIWVTYRNLSHFRHAPLAGHGVPAIVFNLRV
jgi:hypothetical protein